MTTIDELAALRSRLAAACRPLSPEAADLVQSLARPAIRLLHTDTATRSHLGGWALLDDADQWPGQNGRPLALLAVLDLEELAPFESEPALPPQGILNFFYDDEQQPWGFEPADRGGWHVALADPATARPVSPPEGAASFVSTGLAPRQTLSIPGWEEPAVASICPHPHRSSADEAANQAYFSVEDAWVDLLDLDSAPNHQIGGWPRLQQGPIWRECDVVSRGLPLGTSDEWARAEPSFDVEREADWRLLLQLDTDAHAGWMWGDVGTLFFTLRASLPLRAGLGEGWLVLQCG